MVSMSQFQLAPSIIHGQTRKRVQAMLADVRHLLEGLTLQHMKHLFMIQASPRQVLTHTHLHKCEMERS